MKRIGTCFVLIALTSAVPGALLYAGLDSKRAQYVGGTLTLKAGVEGTLSVTDPNHLVFTGRKGEKFSTPYERVTSIAYGQTAFAPLGIASRPIFFSNKRRHYVTLKFRSDQGRTEVAVFQLGKEVIRPTLAGLEARTGKEIEYEEDEARKAVNK